ncbi:MAG: hypothetical protein KIT80_02960 [Chitinophagaceae bacterium]|nr:hypothetical protein [Chitinophagaceae bacterium]MCW5925845.1 hypothetical protein [Chitinophagaceae bacterium]
MRLFDQIFKATTLDKIKKAFDFLVTDFGFKLLTAKKVGNFRADNYLVYRNGRSNIQIEICADDSWFHSIIRRVSNNVPADYNDNVNCLSFEDLALWESENNYDHFDYYAGGKNGLTGVLENTAKLFKRNKNILTTEIWLDTNHIQNLKDKAFERQFGKIPDRSKPTFFSRLKKASKQHLEEVGYKLTLDSDLTSPFDINSITHKLVFKKGRSGIEISQKDWREDYFIYQVFKDEKKVFDIDVSKIDIDRAVELTTDKIKQAYDNKNGRL